MKVKLIPDTNILLNHISNITTLINLNLPFTPFLLIPQTVLSELDNLKKDITYTHSISQITALIQNNSYNKKVLVEGQHGFPKMDIIKENGLEHEAFKLKQGTNDDKILSFLLDHTDGIFLTSDKLFYHKARSYGVECLCIMNRAFDVNAIVFAITKIVNGESCDEYVGNIYSSRQSNCEIRDNMAEEERITFNAVYDVVRDVVNKKKIVGFGGKWQLDLIGLISFVIKRFDFFMDIFANDVKKILDEIKQNLVRNVEIKRNCKKLLIIFRQMDVEL